MAVRLRDGLVGAVKSRCCVLVGTYDGDKLGAGNVASECLGGFADLVVRHAKVRDDEADFD